MFQKLASAITAIFIFACLPLLAQNVLTGTVYDSEENLPLPGVNVIVDGTSDGTTTDFDGKFEITTNQDAGALQVSYIGYSSQQIKFEGSKDFGKILLEPNSEALEDVVVFADGLIDIASDRRTPVAVSTIKKRTIQSKIGNQEFPEIMKNTPSVYVNNQAGGYGDGAVYVRGFDQTNTAFLLNGQPINGMEDGRMYWSNWSGMTDIANAIQVQRGLGSSKLAISSVGGTVNIITKATEKERGGIARFIVGNNEFVKALAGYNTGMNEKGFGLSVMFSHWQGDGFNEGTRGQGQSYFISAGYEPNEKHLFNFLIFGAPQWHDQNFTKPIADYLEYGVNYNGNWGYLNGDYKTFRRNYYHKPVANLNWEWDISERSGLSTVLYASWGRGGGTGPLGRTRYADENGQVDFDAIVANNDTISNAIGTSSTAGLVRASVNNHNWVGGVTNFNYLFSEKLELSVGADIRTYKGTHFRQIVDFLGLEAYRDRDNLQIPNNLLTEAYEPNPYAALSNYAPVGQRYAWDYDERITYGGLFGQIEYRTELFSTFMQGSISRQSHTRWDRYQYTEENEQSPTVNNNGYNIKGGFSYSPNEKNSFYVNSGYYSRQPYHDNIYLNFGNRVNPLTENEKVLGLEAGYRLRTLNFDLNVNLYRTTWEDRVTTTEGNADSAQAALYNVDVDDIIYFNNSGVNQLHQGIEVDFRYRTTNKLSFAGFASIGDWTYNEDVFRRVFDEDQNLLAEEVQEVQDGRVGNAAQTTLGLGTRYYIIRGLLVDLDFRYYDNLYADVVTNDNIELPSFGILDAGASYTLPLENNRSFIFRLNINNLLDKEYISQSRTAIRAGDSRANGEEYEGIDTANQVFFGNGLTWNAAVSFNF